MTDLCLLKIWYSLVPHLWEKGATVSPLKNEQRENVFIVIMTQLGLRIARFCWNLVFWTVLQVVGSRGIIKKNPLPVNPRWRTAPNFNFEISTTQSWGLFDFPKIWYRVRSRDSQYVHYRLQGQRSKVKVTAWHNVGYIGAKTS